MKMNIVWLVSAVMSLLSAGCVGAVVEREVSVSVTVQTETGQPLRGIGVELLGCTDGTGLEYYSGVTDDQGTCNIDAWVCEDLTQLQMKIWVPKRNGFDDYHAVFLEARESIDNWGFQSLYQIPVPAGDSAQLVVTVPEAVTVTGRLVDSTGNAVEGMVGRLRGIPVSRVGVDGAFSLAGVPRSQDTWIHIEWVGGNRVQMIRVPGSDLGEDLDLGDIVCQPIVSDAHLDVQLIGWSDLSMPWFGRRAAPMIIRDDVGAVAEGQVLDSGQVFFNFDITQHSVGLPAGEYFIIPAALNWSEEVVWILDAIEQQDPRLAALPRTILSVGESKSVEIDCEQVLDLIRQEFGDP